MFPSFSNALHLGCAKLIKHMKIDELSTNFVSKYYIGHNFFNKGSTESDGDENHTLPKI